MTDDYQLDVLFNLAFRLPLSLGGGEDSPSFRSGYLVLNFCEGWSNQLYRSLGNTIKLFQSPAGNLFISSFSATFALSTGLESPILIRCPCL